MKKLSLLILLIIFQYKAESQNLVFNGQINGKEINMKEFSHQIKTRDTLVISITDEKGKKYSAENYKVKYYKLADGDGKMQRQEMIFEKVFKKSVKVNSDKIEIIVKQILIDKEFYKVEIIPEDIFYYDAAKKKNVYVSLHPARRTFIFLYYP